jgi:hypothetical protein
MLFHIKLDLDSDLDLYYQLNFLFFKGRNGEGSSSRRRY